MEPRLNICLQDTVLSVEAKRCLYATQAACLKLIDFHNSSSCKLRLPIQVLQCNINLQLFSVECNETWYFCSCSVKRCWYAVPTRTVKKPWEGCATYDFGRMHAWVSLALTDADLTSKKRQLWLDRKMCFEKYTYLLKLYSLNVTYLKAKLYAGCNRNGPKIGEAVMTCDQTQLTVLMPLGCPRLVHVTQTTHANHCLSFRWNFAGNTDTF